jgi:hypothetical protein
MGSEDTERMELQLRPVAVKIIFKTLELGHLKTKKSCLTNQDRTDGLEMT